MNQTSFFAEENRLEILSKLGDSLEWMIDGIPWETFRPILNHALRKEEKGPGGRPPYDYILLFKIVLLQKIYSLSDDAVEFQINDRLSFQRFLGLGLSDKVPDAKTIWHFKNRLAENREDTRLFDEFARYLDEKGILMKEGVIVDATFIEAPRQRNTREENASIKENKIPETWKADNPKSKHKLAQKDMDARWAKKNGITYYGYKDHVGVDKGSKLITAYEVTPASSNDSTVFYELLSEETRDVWADSAYSHYMKKLPEGIVGHICSKSCRYKKLTAEEIVQNRIMSKTRCRVEHVFARMKDSGVKFLTRSIGLARAAFGIGMLNLAYNMQRYGSLREKLAFRG